MKDFSFWEEYDGVSAGSGRGEKVWLLNPDTNQIGLFKFKKDKETTDHVSECIAYEIAELVGIPCAKFELGIYKNREGSMSYNIADEKDVSLIEGIYCITATYASYDPNEMMDMETGKRYSLEMIQDSLESFGLFEEFLKIPVFDFLIGNSDRHQSNWALLQKNGEICLCPLYDNGSSLCSYVSNEKVEQYLGKDKLLWHSLIDTKSRSIIRIHSDDKKKPTHLEVIKYLHTYYYSQTKDIAYSIIEKVTKDNIQEILEHYTEELGSLKQELLEKYIMSKIDLLKDIYQNEDNKPCQ